MKKKDFIKLKIPYNKKSIGLIKLNTVNILPEGISLLEDINDILDHTGSIDIDIVFFLRNIEDKFYIELTNKDTNIDLLQKYIDKGNVIYI